MTHIQALNGPVTIWLQLNTRIFVIMSAGSLLFLSEWGMVCVCQTGCGPSLWCHAQLTVSSFITRQAERTWGVWHQNKHIHCHTANTSASTGQTAKEKRLHFVILHFHMFSREFSPGGSLFLLSCQSEVDLAMFHRFQIKWTPATQGSPPTDWFTQISANSTDF